MHLDPVFLLVVLASAIAFILGKTVGRSVPDEIEPSRAYLRLAPDALILIMAVLSGTTLLLIVAPMLLASRVLLTKPLIVHAMLGGMILAITQNNLVIVPICITMNYIAGALTENFHEASLCTIIQPLAAGLTLLVV